MLARLSARARDSSRRVVQFLYEVRSQKIVMFEPKMFRIAQNNQKWMCFLLNRFPKQFKTVFKTMTLQKILDGDLRKIAKCSLKIKIYEVLCEKHEFSCSERLRLNIRSNSELELKNRDFWTKNVPDCSKSSKVNMLFTQSLPEAVQNRVQNLDFSENPKKTWKHTLIFVAKKRVPRLSLSH